MSEEIRKVLDDLGQRLGLAIDWSSENVLPYMKDLLERFINYEQARTIFWLIISSIITIGFLILLIKTIRYIGKEIKENDLDIAYDLDEVGSAIAIAVFLGLGVVCSIFSFLTNTEKLIQLKYIPEKTMIEYIKYEI